MTLPSSVAAGMVAEPERKVLDLLAAGHTCKEVARQLSIHPITMSRLLRAARERNGCATTYQLLFEYGKRYNERG